MSLKLSNPKYYKIDKHYLISVFGKQLVKDAKYLYKPFIGFDNSNIMIAIPEKTIHKTHKYKYPYNYYFSDNIHILDIASFIYVPFDKRREFFIDKNKDFQIKLNEIALNIPFIEVKIKSILSRLNRDIEFEKNHKHIKKSKKLSKRLFS